MIKTYNKLIRDNIPEVIEKAGKTCKVETLANEDFLIKLDEKLNEEVSEYQEDKALEELADILEVMRAIVKAKGYTWEQLEDVRMKKAGKNGAFEKRLLLKEVVENGDSRNE